MEGAEKARLREPLVEPAVLVTVPGVSRAIRASGLRLRPVVTPDGLAAVIEAV